jgi:broad specificity phosphatase PhoE
MRDHGNRDQAGRQLSGRPDQVHALPGAGLPTRRRGHHRGPAGPPRRRLRSLKIDAVYASPLRRARETAEALGLPITRDERLIEVAADTSSGLVEVLEPPEETVRRMRAAVADAVARHPGGRVVMVGHGVAILHYLCDVLGLQPGTLRLLPYYTSLNVVRIKDDRRMVGALADVAHLEGMDWLS